MGAAMWPDRSHGGSSLLSTTLYAIALALLDGLSPRTQGQGSSLEPNERRELLERWLQQPFLRLEVDLLPERPSGFPNQESPY